MTMRELARELRLSTSTVSRALTRPEMVAPETLERVREAVRIHGYRPKRIAQSLRTRTTRSIGVIVSDIMNPFYSAIVRAVEGVAADNGFSVIICNADESPEREAEALWVLAERRVTGIIHASTGANPDTLRRLRTQGIALVDVDRASGLEGTDTVLVDNVAGAREATRHLLGLGHRRVATITGPVHLTTGRDRLRGFQMAHEEAGLPVAPAYVAGGDFRRDSAYHAALRLLALPDAPTALFVANNEMLIGALRAIRERGVVIPSQLSLVSFDDVPWAVYVDPPLTVVAQPTEALGRTSAELLFRRLGGAEEPRTVVLAPRLRIRHSTAPPATLADGGSEAAGPPRIGPHPGRW
jgi:DNA-binding LacI/PurR family transcriptional regulator